MIRTGDGARPDAARAARAFIEAEELGLDVRDAAAQLPPRVAEQVLVGLDGA